MHKLDLPEPGLEEKRHSARLRALIEQTIAEAGGWIDFGQYMQLALYAPGLGYYSAGLQKFGEQGDFITAPEISPLFARTLAGPISKTLDLLGGGDVLEFGAGSGRFAADLLRQLSVLGRAPERYCIIELSAELRHRQQQTLAHLCPEFVGRVHWLDTLPRDPIDGVVVANEVLDAMPVRRFLVTESGIAAMGVAKGEQGLVLEPRPADDALQRQVEHIQEDIGMRLPCGYMSEINGHLEPWFRSLASSLNKGAVYLIDYGYPRSEYYLAERSAGTCMGYYRHRAFDDPLWYPGIQDLTAFVDFTAVAEAAVATGFELEGFTSQGNFLMDSGVLKFMDEVEFDNEQQRMQSIQQIRTLTQNTEMGERFKVMALSMNLSLHAEGFGLRDYSWRL